MVKDQTPTQPRQPATPRISSVLAACQAARAKFQEAGAALHAVTVAAKEAEKSQRATEKDLSAARSMLKKLKSLSF